MLSLLDNSLRATNFVFLILILALIGSLIATQKSSNSRVNFAIFTAIFGLVSDSFYGIFANFSSAFTWPVILFTWDFLNFIFTFSAATALAVGTRTHSCGNKEYLDSNGIAEGSSDRCHKAQASTAFLYFSFFIFVVKLAMSAFNVFGANSMKKNQVGVPTISQV